MEFGTPALKVLLAIARRERTSTTALSERVGLSQQSVSRVITELTKEQLVRKTLTRDGLDVVLTDAGYNALKAFHAVLGDSLGNHGPILRGIIEAGLGEGKYYVSRPEYHEHFVRLLGQEPFAGTLNVHVDPIEKQRFLAQLKSEKIPGFSAHGRTYGSVMFYPIRIRDRECGLILPERRIHGPERVELVASVNLRRAYGLRDGDELVMEAQ